MGMAWPSTLPMPLLDGYLTSPGAEAVRTDMESGEARVRRRSVAAPDSLKLAWILDAAQMQIFRAYWDVELAAGAAWCDMTIDVGDGVEQKSVRIIGQYQAARISPGHWKVSCEAEVRKLRPSVFDYLNLMGLPSLDLDFAGTQSLSPVITSARQPSPAVSFARASEATYFGADGLLKIAADNEPRFDFDPVTLVCKGLLIEEARTNLLLYSEDLSGSGWSASGASVSANAAASPDGSMTADKLVESATTATHYICRSASITSGVTYSVQFFAKAAERSVVQFAVTSAVFPATHINFDLAAGTVSALGASISGSIVPLSDGYFLCQATLTATATSATSFVYLVIANSPTMGRFETYAGDGSSGLYLWGAQLEVGSSPTSYIPTTSAAASRSADLASLAGAGFTSWFNAGEGTVVVDGDSAGALVGHYPWCLSDNINSQSSAMLAAQFRVSSNQIRVWQSTSGGSLDDFITPSGANKYGRLSVAYGAGLKVSASALGGAVVTMASNMQTSLFNGLVIGNAAGFAGAVNGHISRLTYYPKRLPNATLQALSA